MIRARRPAALSSVMYITYPGDLPDALLDPRDVQPLGNALEKDDEGFAQALADVPQDIQRDPHRQDRVQERKVLDPDHHAGHEHCQPAEHILQEVPGDHAVAQAQAPVHRANCLRNDAAEGRIDASEGGVAGRPARLHCRSRQSPEDRLPVIDWMSRRHTRVASSESSPNVHSASRPAWWRIRHCKAQIFSAGSRTSLSTP